MSVFRKPLLFTASLLSMALFSPIQAADSAPDPLADAPKPAFEGQTDAPAAGQYEVAVLATDLQLPRSLVALPDGDLLVTEGAGTVRLLSPQGELSEPLQGMPAFESNNGRGMNDFILGADFAENRTVYFTYAAPGREQVVRARLSEDKRRIEDPQVIANIPGRRLVSAEDGSVYVSTMAYGDTRAQAQQQDSLAGKFLRINADGSIPSDNPFAGEDQVRDEIFSLGHRDPDGLFIHPETGELWAIEHGPMGGDELNIIRAGRNYGWPEATYGKNYDGTPIAPTHKEGTEQPLYFWHPSIAPSGLLVYTGDLFPHWRNSVFLGAMSPTQGKFLVRLETDGEKVVAEERLLQDRDRRVRALAQGAEGALYVLTDSEDNDELGRHFPGEVLRLTPHSW